MLVFPNLILFVGFGAGARCTLPILLKHNSVNPKLITIIDFASNEAALQPWIKQGAAVLFGVACTRIGVIEADASLRIVDQHGGAYPPKLTGFDHFRGD